MAKDLEFRKQLKPLKKLAYGTDLTANDATPQEAPGQEMELWTPYGPAKFRYIKNTAGTTRGYLLSYVSGVTIANVLSGSTTTAVTTGLTANLYQYDVLCVVDVNASAGASPEGYGSPILSNTATTFYLDPQNPLPAALAVNDDCYVYTFCKTEAAAAGDSVSDVCGVAMTTITATYWGWVQYDGYCAYAAYKAATAMTADKALIADTAKLSVSSTSADELLLGSAPQGFGYSNDIVDDIVCGAILNNLGSGRQVSA